MALNLSRYEDRLDQYNYGEKDYYIEQNKQLILKGFNTHPSYQSIKLNNVDRDVHILDDNTLTKDPNRKILLIKPNETASVGDYIEWDNYNWLIINIDNNKDIQHRCYMYRCNGRLNWIDNSGKINSYWCVRQELSRASSGTSENKYITTPNRLNTILVQSNSDTDLIRERNETRFIFGEKSFLTHDTDRELIDGLVVITTEEDEINFETDKEVDVNGEILWIANYTNKSEFVVNINESDSDLINGNTLQLSAQVTKDGQVVSEEVVWSSSDENIATVDNNGLVSSVALGSVVITCAMKNNSSVSDTVNISVVNSVVDNFSYSVTPNDSGIVLTDTTIFEVQGYNNGVPIVETYTFGVDGSTTADGEDYEFVVVDDTSFSIKNVNDGKVVSVKIVPDSNVGAEFVKNYSLDYFY